MVKAVLMWLLLNAIFAHALKFPDTVQTCECVLCMDYINDNRTQIHLCPFRVFP